MANRERREALRGAEEETFDLLAEVWRRDQWAELLKAPLERAARQGTRGLAQMLVRAGAEIGDALHEAARGGHGDVVSDLLENGAPVDAKDTSHDGLTPLHVAAEGGKTEIVQLLLLKGADKDPMDKYKCTPLHLAAINGREPAALALMAAGADVNLRSGQYKRSVLHLATQRGLVDIMRAAIERGADVEAVDTFQDTPLHCARYTTNNKVEAANVLLEAGANVEARDYQGFTPLHHATNPEAALALLKHGAHINAPAKDQQTPLHAVAANAGSVAAAEMVDLFLRSGADETILNDQGEAAVDVVAKNVEEHYYQQYQLAEDVERVRELLAKAPADRAWRRRGFLVLCRAHPDRVQQVHESSSACAGLAQMTTSSAKLARTAAGSKVDGRTGGDWVVVAARVLELQEEGIFRTIVGYM